MNNQESEFQVPTIHGLLTVRTTLHGRTQEDEKDPTVTCQSISVDPPMGRAEFERIFVYSSWTQSFDRNNLEQTAIEHVRGYLGIPEPTS